MSKVNNFLIPNVSSLPSDTRSAEKANALKKGEQSEFKGLVDQLTKKIFVSLKSTRDMLDRKSAYLLMP